LVPWNYISKKDAQKQFYKFQDVVANPSNFVSVFIGQGTELGFSQSNQLKIYNALGGMLEKSTQE
jgi:hypothetical protein